MPTQTSCLECHSKNGGVVTTCQTCHSYHASPSSKGFQTHANSAAATSLKGMMLEKN